MQWNFLKQIVFIIAYIEYKNSVLIAVKNQGFYSTFK